MDFGDIKLRWLGHAGFQIKNSMIIYIDPYNIRDGLEKADIILITHSHYDHCSQADIQKIIKEGTTIITPADCQSKIARFNIPIKIKLIEPNQEVEIGGIRISTLPAYNIDKPFHPRDGGWVGYLIKMKKTLIYHAGDTDSIKDMRKLTGYRSNVENFVALLPIGGRFTMSSEEAVEAAKVIKPTVAIPMHYGSIVGSKDDAEEFLELCKEEGINAKILEKE